MNAYEEFRKQLLDKPLSSNTNSNVQVLQNNDLYWYSLDKWQGKYWVYYSFIKPSNYSNINFSCVLAVSDSLVLQDFEVKLLDSLLYLPESKWDEINDYFNNDCKSS